MSPATRRPRNRRSLPVNPETSGPQRLGITVQWPTAPRASNHGSATNIASPIKCVNFCALASPCFPAPPLLLLLRLPLPTLCPTPTSPLPTSVLYPSLPLSFPHPLPLPTLHRAPAEVWLQRRKHLLQIYSPPLHILLPLLAPPTTTRSAPPSHTPDMFSMMVSGSQTEMAPWPSLNYFPCAAPSQD